MNILTKSVAKEVTDAGMKNIRDMEFINTPIESSAVEIFYSKYWFYPFINEPTHGPYHIVK